MFLQVINFDLDLSRFRAPERLVPEQRYNGVWIPIHKTKHYIYIYIIT
jgi:hypothetical protein